MKNEACQYSIIQFMPYAETGEFANVGIVLMCPRARYFGFLLQDKRWARVTRFFGDVDAKIYKECLRYVRDELKRFRTVLKTGPIDGRKKYIDEDLATRLFREATRTRETIVRFGHSRAILTSDPKAELKRLFGFYVEHDFATKEYRETTMTRRVRKLLADFHLSDAYVEDRVGNDEFKVKFPFVHRDETDTRVIKPLHLAHDDPTKILEHGGTWLNRIDRLKRRGLLPNASLFAVEGPGSTSGDSRVSAFKEICGDLDRQGVLVVDHMDSERIVGFASQGIDVLRFDRPIL